MVSTVRETMDHECHQNPIYALPVLRVPHEIVKNNREINEFQDSDTLLGGHEKLLRKFEFYQDILDSSAIF